MRFSTRHNAVSDGKRKMQRIIGAAETIGNNEDVLQHLLVRLPAQSLVRFKCVSKQWLSIISNPNFCDSHTLQNPNPKFSSAFFWSRTGTTTGPHFISHVPSSKRPLNFIPDPQGIKILQSCNGLLLCGSSIESFTTPRKFYIVNPTTSQYFQLALPPKSIFARVLSVALAFDPSKSLHYKVVCISGWGTTQIKLEIYSSQTRSWRVCESNDMWFPSTGNFLPGVYCNGSINWLSRFCWLVHYDIDAGHYGVVDEFCGDNRSVETDCICFGESGGNLHLIQVYSSGLNQFDVLEMARDYSGWSVKYRIDLNPMTVAFPDFYAGYYPFLFLHVEENEKENPSLLLHIPCNVISYNLRDKSFKKLFDLVSTSLVGWRDAFHCMETLSCV